MRSLLVFILLYLVINDLDAHLIYPSSLTGLISESDAIVTGKIISVSDSTYVLEVKDTIKGKVPKLVTLPLLPAYVGYGRWNVHQNVGQTELAFLKKNTLKKITTWTLTSHDGVSEILIANDSIYIYNNGWSNLVCYKNYPLIQINIDNNRFNADPYLLSEMVTAIKDFDKDKQALSKQILRDIAKSENMYADIRLRQNPKITNELTISFSKRSRSHRRLIDELKEKQGYLSL